MSRCKLRVAIGGLIAGLALAGCTTSPVTGETRLAPIPNPVVDIRSSLALQWRAGDRLAADAADDPLLTRFRDRLGRVFGRLGDASAHLYREAPPIREIYLADNAAPGCSSHPGRGVIAVHAGLIDLPLADDELALVLAREMAPIVADHLSQRGTGATLTSAAATLLFPLRTALRLASSLIGAGIVENRLEAEQQREADDIAVNLLMYAGYDLHAATRPRPLWSELRQSRPGNAWLADHSAALERIRGILPPQAAEAAPAKLAAVDERPNNGQD